MEHRNSVLIVEDDVNINGLLKEALEKDDLDEIKKKTESLQEVTYALAAKVYQQAQQAQQQAQDNSQQSNDSNVEDAEFKEVKDDEDKK